MDTPEFNLWKADVIERDSRVTVIAGRGEEKFRAHLRNTGRLNDLIYPGATLLCVRKKTGKTDARVIGAEDGEYYVLLDTYVQEKYFASTFRAGRLSWLIPDSGSVNSQVSRAGKRLDFSFEVEGNLGFIEMKSAVTCEDGWASYPDAPSERGLEHVELMEKLSRDGAPAFIVFIVTHPECDGFRPNYVIQPEIGEALRRARKAGVGLFAVKMVLNEDGDVSVTNEDLPVRLAP